MKKFLSVILLLSFALSLSATKRIVTLSTDNAKTPAVGMLRYWINNASTGDTIIFSVSTVNLDTTLRINGGKITIDGGNGVTINGNSKDRVFNISCYTYDNIQIKNLTVQNGKTESVTAMGGGMYAFVMSGTLNVQNCTFKNNAVISTNDGQGGALRTNGGTFHNCFFLNNTVSGTTSTLGGGGIFATGGTFINCVIAGNSAKYGGGIYSSGSANFTNCTITQNTTSVASNGGGINTEDDCSYTNCIIYNNKSAGAQDNISNYLNSSTFTNCALESGNSLVGTSQNIGLTVTPFTHLGNDSLSLLSGSACENKGTSAGITVLSYDIAGRKRVNGGTIDIGAYEYNLPIYKNITVTSNSSDRLVAYSLPWAIEHADSACVITFSSNFTIDIVKELTISESIFIDGAGKTIILDGKGSKRIFNITGTANDTVVLRNLIIQNGYYQYDNGGGLKGNTSKNNNIYIINCVFDNNKAPSNYGGGIYITDKATIINSTFHNNTAHTGGGAYVGSEGNFINCLFYDNKASKDKDYSGKCTFKNSASKSVLEGENNVLLYSNPFIGGSGSDRWQLVSGSYCSNAGTLNLTDLKLAATDISGSLRVLKDTIDIGAYESNYNTTPARKLYKTIVVSNSSFDAEIENSLLWALAHADTTCTITFSDNFTINVTSDMILSGKKITIDGKEHTIILDGGDNTRIFTYIGKPNSVVYLKNLIIQKGKSYQGGGIYADVKTGGNLYLISCTVKNNKADNGGGMTIIPGNGSDGVYVINCAFISNSANTYGGGIQSDYNTWRIYNLGNFYTNCTFTKNTAGYEGGAIYSQGNATFRNCLFFENKTPNRAGVNIINGGTVSYCAADVNLHGGNNVRLYESPFEIGTINLHNKSFCSNSGTPDTTGLKLPPKDLNNNYRIINGKIDIGAIESSYNELPAETLYDNIVVKNNSSDVHTENSLFWGGSTY
ncbi:MAG: hypothetical protein HC905_15125 [Bacteroidales bacterium]|nr:hypothetical protein [Bacteroidales bacterium]